MMMMEIITRIIEKSREISWNTYKRFIRNREVTDF
jgi:hypothetical protein